MHAVQVFLLALWILPMSVLIGNTRAALNTSTGTQSITVAGLGTPKAAIFSISRAITDGNAAAGATLARGWTDGVRSRCVYASQQDSQATTATHRGYVSGSVFSLRNGSGTVLAEAAFSAWVTDGVEINITSTNGTAYLCQVELIGGTEPQVYVGNFNSSATIGGALPVTAPGFTPHTVFLLGAATSNATPTAAGASFLYGAADQIGTVITQRSIAFGSANGTAEGAPAAYVSDTYPRLTLAAGVIGGVDFTSFDTNGFTVVTRNEAVSYIYPYLAVRWGSRQHKLVTMSPPITAIAQSYTWPGFTPQAVWHGMTQVAAVNTHTTDGSAGRSR